jgi:hypothetical protein
VDAPLGKREKGCIALTWSHAQVSDGPNRKEQPVIKSTVDECKADKTYSIGHQSEEMVLWIHIYLKIKATATVDKQHETELAQLYQEYPILNASVIPPGQIDEYTQHHNEEIRLVASQRKTHGAQIEAIIEVGKLGGFFVVDCDDEIHSFYSGVLITESHVQAHPIAQKLKQCETGCPVTKFYNHLLTLSESGQCAQSLSQLQSTIVDAAAPCAVASLDNGQLEVRMGIVDIDPKNAGLVLRYRQGEVLSQAKLAAKRLNMPEQWG